MKRIRIVVAAGLVLLLFLGIVVMGAQDKKQQEVERQLRAAINTELNERNLKSAIEQYKKVAESGIRPLAAQALLHMADCYRQLGENDAQKVYDRIVNEYGDQTDVVAVARTQLVRMGSPATGRNMRRVCSWGPDCEGRISPDGKLIASIKFEGTYVRNLATGEARKIAEQVQDLLWAPDSKRLAYRSRAGSDSRSNSGVYVINADGADSRVIYRSAYTLLAWSSDGKRLLVDAPANSGEAAREPAKLLWITVSNGIAEPLPTKLRNPNGPAQVSPDGRHIAVNAAPDRSVSADSVPRGRGRGSPVGRSLYILASDGSGEASVMVSGAFPVLGWNRQGTQVFFRQADGSDLWAISVSGGKPQGDPVVVQSLERTAGGNDAYIREIADSETMYFDRPVGNETYTASFDTSTGKITSLPVRLPSGNGHRLAHWSTDGRRMLFVRDRDFWVFTFDSAAFASGTERRFVAGPDQLEPS
jgi:WD40 repeat protein